MKTLHSEYQKKTKQKESISIMVGRSLQPFCSRGFNGCVFKDILAAFVVLFLHFCVGLLIYSKVLHLFSPLFKRQACVHCVNGNEFCLDVCFLQVCVSVRVCFVVFGLIPIIPQVCLCCLLLGAQVSPFCCL